MLKRVIYYIFKLSGHSNTLIGHVTNPNHTLPLSFLPLIKAALSLLNSFILHIPDPKVSAHALEIFNPMNLGYPLSQL